MASGAAVLVTSRSYDEYLAMFALQSDALSGRRVLDCSAGASSFVTNARRAGCVALAADPAYALAKDVLAQTAGSDNHSGAGIAVANADRFTWSWYGGREQRDRIRARALAEFVLDIAVSGGRYVAARLPQLPFRDAAFDLALCSHLLFTWADQLGCGWHLAALRELSRIAEEVRVFPTLVQGRGEQVPFWSDLMADLRADGLRAEKRRVDYEFQLGGNEMLVLTRG